MSQISHDRWSGRVGRNGGLKPGRLGSGSARSGGRSSGAGEMGEAAWASWAMGRTFQVSFLTVMVLAVMLSLLVVRAGFVMRHPGTPIQTLLNTQFSQASLSARRGDLLDRRGQILATTDVRFRLFADPAVIDDFAMFLLRVEEVTGLDGAEIARQMAARPGSRFVVLDTDLDASLVPAVRALNLRGLGIQRQSRRLYPHGPLAGQVLGFHSDHAAMGAERAMQPWLAGEDGQIRFLRDARMRPLAMPHDGYRPVNDGRDVRLSLDVNIQRVVERHLRETCEKYGAPRGQVVVMDPRTGEILAMAQYPVMNPMEIGRSAERDRNIASISEVFEPGSTFKPFVWAILLEAGLVQVSDVFDGHQGRWRAPFGRRMRDASPHGTMNFEEVLIKSSNIGMAQGALRMSGRKLREELRKFGFGQPTNVGLPGEVGGLMTSARNWSLYTQTSVSMGHEIAITPLQIMTAFSTLANGGYSVRPTIRMLSSGADRTEIQGVRVLSEPVAVLTVSTLRRAVEEGTGRALRGKPYQPFGKTGTAQIPASTGGYEPGAYVASFIGGAPSSEPRVVIGCFIHRPDPSKGFFGGVVAAPLAASILDEIMKYLDD